MGGPVPPRPPKCAHPGAFHEVVRLGGSCLVWGVRINAPYRRRRTSWGGEILGWDGDEGGKVFGAVEVWGWGVDGKGGHVVWGIGAGGAFIEVSHEDVSGVCVDAWEGDVDGECPGAWVLIGGGTAKDVARDLGVLVGEKWAP